jgi:hypothetical protein
MQMASELSFRELVALGYELCGGYRLDSKGEVERGFRDDLSLTNTTKLASYISRAAEQKGRVTALKALRYLADNSASPMETILTMLLTMPYQYGGYGFAVPKLNFRIDVPGKQRNSKKGSEYYGDLYWPEAKVDVEYDSDAYHTATDFIAKDAVRRNALSFVGATVVTVSRRQIANTEEMHKIAVLLSKLLKKRLQYPMPEFLGRRAALRKELFANRGESSPVL